jgi:hypothetical protein
MHRDSGDRLGIGLNLSAGCTVKYPTAVTQTTTLSHAIRIAQSSGGRRVLVLLSGSAGTERI